MLVTKALVAFGDRVVFGSGDMAHPVLWTWCASRDRDGEE